MGEIIGIHIAVLAIADDPTKADLSTVNVVAERAIAAGHRIVARTTVKDSEAAIHKQLERWIARSDIDVVIASGGIDSAEATGALKPLITEVIPGFTDLFRYLAYQDIGAGAMLSNAEAARCGSTLVFLLPASVAAVTAAMEKLLLPQLDHRTRPRNLVMLMPRVRTALDAKNAMPAMPSKNAIPAMPAMPAMTPRAPIVGPPAAAVPQAIVAEKTASGVGGIHKLPANMIGRRKPPTANIIARDRVIADDPATKPIELASLERQIAISTEPSPNDAPTKRFELVGLPLVPPGADGYDELDEVEEVDETADGDEPVDTLEEMPVEVPPSRPTPVPVRVRQPTPPPPPAVEAPRPRAITQPPPPPRARPITQPPPPPRARPITQPPPPPRARPITEPPPPVARPRTRPGTQPPPVVRMPVYPIKRRSTTSIVLVLGLIALAVGATVGIVVVKSGSEKTPIAAAASEAGQPIDAPSAVALAEPSQPAPPEEAAPAAPTEPAEIDLEPQAREPRPTPPTGTRPVRPTPVVKPAGSSATPETGPVTRPESAGSAVQPTPPPPPAPAADPECDEVSCVMEHYARACCARYRPADTGPRPRSGIPEELDRTMAKAGVEKMKPRVIACGEKSPAKGTVKLSIAVTPEGSVKSVTVTETPDAALGECVAAALRKTTFGKTVNGGTFLSPFVF